MKEINDIMRIIEALKQECQKIRKSKDHISIEEVAETMEISVHTLKNGMDCAVTPYKSIINFCNKHDINTDDIFFADITRTCMYCPNELVGDNMQWYSTRKLDENGKRIQKMKRQCKSCYRKERREAMKKRYDTMKSKK